MAVQSGRFFIGNFDGVNNIQLIDYDTQAASKGSSNGHHPE
ncbi:MAG: hypothetical protein AAGD32_11590 [Planctomycetota bacterium]